MGVESLLLIFLCVVYGYHATVLLFGTSHCLAIILGEGLLLLLLLSAATTRDIVHLFEQDMFGTSHCLAIILGEAQLRLGAAATLDACALCYIPGQHCIRLMLFALLFWDLRCSALGITASLQHGF
jgi:hypothetical protein